MAADEIIPPDPEESIEEAEELVEPDPIPEEAIVDEADDENLPEEELPPMPDPRNISFELIVIQHTASLPFFLESQNHYQCSCSN